MTLNLLFIAIAAFIVVLVLIPPARLLAMRIGLVDEPDDERKHHDDAVPPIGGLIILPVFMAAVILMGGEINTYGVLFITLIMLLVVGAIDDMMPLHPWFKFAVQILAATLVVVFGGARIYTLGDMFGFGEVSLGWMSIPFSIAAVALLVNSINLMDGLDGLAAGKSFVVLGWLVLACFVGHEPRAAMMMIPLLGALTGFLFYNMRHPMREKASVFLGDAGSMGLGLVLAWFCVTLSQEEEPVIMPISIAWIVALPVIDACGQFYRRVREGRHPFSPDRGHFHHHFIHAGVPVGKSTAMILLLGFVLGGIGYFSILAGVPPVIMTLGWLVLLFSHMAVSERAEHYIRLFSRFADPKANVDK
jgi:UDP-GlcNAc:undecaprenyl-phosphate/decaprenyl-phosphate GlcNAc-1-phosphate transferase